MEDDFNDAIDEIILDYRENNGLTTDEMISALELKVMAMKEET